MAPDKKKFRPNQVFDIITGYYPDVAADLGRKKRLGKGQVGLKHIRKRGFTDGSIERARTKRVIDNTMEGDTSERPLDPEKMVGAEGTEMAGKQLWKKITGTKKDKTKIWYKYQGGSEQYKLYGDQVWYMAGRRTGSEVEELTDYVNSFEGQNSPRFSNIYSKMEPKLIQQAKQMVTEMFDEAVQLIDEGINEGTREGGPMSSEEMGYSAGDFEYLNHDQVIQQYGNNPEIMAQIQKIKGSTANPGDLYRIKNGQLELIQDVTEMPLEQKGQHGIVDLPKELIQAIKEIKAGDNEDLEALRQGVQKMYTNAIKDEYNPVIESIKSVSENYGKPQKDSSWKDLLKDINDITKKSGKGANMTSVGDIASVIGVEIAKSSLKDTSKKTGGQIALELVSHILGRINENTQARFRQSHRVHTDPLTGMSVYASADLTPNPQTMLFDLPVGLETIGVYEGYSASLAQENLAAHGIKDRGLELHKGQKHAYSATKVTGMQCTGTGVASATANMGIAKGLKPATVVHWPASDRLEQALIDDIKNGLPDIAHRLGRGKTGLLQKNTYGLNRNTRRMTRGRSKSFKSTQFWALPYVGVLQSEYMED